VNTELHAPVPVAPELLAPAGFGLPDAPPPPRDPVWSGWDVLLIAGLTLFTLFVVEFMTVIGARVFVYPHTSLGDLAQKPALALIGEFFSYIAVAIFMIMLG